MLNSLAIIARQLAPAWANTAPSAMTAIPSINIFYTLHTRAKTDSKVTKIEFLELFPSLKS